MVIDIGNAARHTGAEVSAGGSQHNDAPARHVLTCVIPDAFYNCSGSRVAHAEPFANLAVQEQLAASGAVQDDIAGDDVLGCNQISVATFWWPHNNSAARQTLAHIIVCITVQTQGDSVGQKCSEAVSCRTIKVDHDGICRQACATVLLGDLMAEQGTNGAIDVADSKAQMHGL